jgi:chromosomal replication initiation ATPase DnaA
MLLARSRCRADIAVARRLAMYLMHVALGRSIPSVAKLFDRHWSTVMRACFAIEDMRDDEHFDLVVTSLETIIGAARDSHRSRRKEVRHAVG